MSADQSLRKLARGLQYGGLGLMAPMGKPHQRSKAGQVQKGGVAQAYGDKGSNIPELQAELLAAGCNSGGARPVLLARLARLDDGDTSQAPADWLPFVPEAASENLDISGSAVQNMSFEELIPLAQALPAFSAELTFLGEISGLTGEDAAIALRMLRMWYVIFNKHQPQGGNASTGAAAAPAIAGGGALPSSAQQFADTTLFAENDVLVFLMDNAEGTSYLTIGGEGVQLVDKAKLLLHKALREAQRGSKTLDVAAFVAATRSALAPPAAAAESALSAAQSSQVVSAIKTSHQNLEAKIQNEIKNALAATDDDRSEISGLRETLDSVPCSHHLHKRRLELCDEVAGMKRAANDARKSAMDGLVPPVLARTLTERKEDLALLNHVISSNDPVSDQIWEQHVRTKARSGSTREKYLKLAKEAAETQKARVQLFRAQGAGFGGGGFFGGVGGSGDSSGFPARQLGAAAAGNFGAQSAGMGYAGMGAQRWAQATPQVPGLLTAPGLMTGQQFQPQYQPLHQYQPPPQHQSQQFQPQQTGQQTGQQLIPPAPPGAPGSFTGTFNQGQQRRYADPGPPGQPRFYKLPGGDMRLVSSDGARLINMQQGNNFNGRPNKHLDMPMGSLGTGGGGPCFFCTGPHEQFECPILRGWLSEGKVNNSGHPLKHW